MPLLGIDLGTSAVKAVVIDETAELLSVGMREIPMLTPEPNRAEQDPRVWWSSASEAIREAVAAAGTREISAIGVTGQSHGFALIDDAGKPVGNAITWADQRSAELIPELEERIGRSTFLSISGTRPAAGFMGPTLVWLTRYEPARLDRAAAAVHPKDYLRLRMTGSAATDVSDASATALFDITARTWSAELAAQTGIPDRLLPSLLESADIAGELSREAADDLGLSPGIPVVAGCADQPAQAVANGLLDPGAGSITLGTGGQIFSPSDRPTFDPQGRVSTFNHAVPDRWYQLGATLAAGLSLRWLRDLLSLEAESPFAELDGLAEAVPAGADGLTFLPYLVGERSPIMDPLARGAFVGLTLHHGRNHLARAVLEGVACSLRATRDAMADAGSAPDSWLASGNGLASPLWRSIVADTLGQPLGYVAAPERSGVGAALIAGIGTGIYSDYKEAAAVAHRPITSTEPDATRSLSYDTVYARYQHRSTSLLPGAVSNDA